MDTLTPAPPGFAYLKNRGTQRYEDMFDGQSYTFEPGQVRLLPEETARFLHDFSLVQIDMELNRGERVLVMPDDPKWGTPLETADFVELVDRSSGDNPIGKATGGLKTHAAVLPSTGGGKRLTRASIPS